MRTRPTLPVTPTSSTRATAPAATRAVRLPALALAALLAAGAVTLPTAGAAAAPDTGGLNLGGDSAALISADTTALAPGLDVTTFQRKQGTTWVSGSVMIADLTTPTLSMDVLDGGAVSGGGRLSEQIADSGAVAAVNGDYFDIDHTTAPVGTNVSSRGVESAAPRARQTLTVDAGRAAVQLLGGRVTATAAGADLPVAGANTPNLEGDMIGWYTASWGAEPLVQVVDAPVPAAATRFTRVRVVAGAVTEVITGRAALEGDTAIASGSGVLVGRDGGADRLAQLVPGDRVDVTVGTTADVDLAVGGAERLIENGVQTGAEQAAAARTAVGVTRDGTGLIVVSIDGRRGDAAGMTLQQLGRLLLDLGAYNAVNLDGGGSTTLATRQPGETAATLANQPSDGSERIVANSLAFFSSAAAPAPRTATDVLVRPALRGDGGAELLPGLTRTFRGTGLDADRDGLRVDGRFSNAGGAVRVATSDRHTAAVVGVRRGAASVRYSAGALAASTPVRVHGEMVRLRPSADSVALADADASAVVTLEALDADGFGVPVETGDVTVHAGDGVAVQADGLDRFVVTPTTAGGSSTIAFEVLGHRAEVAVTIGFTSRTIADFSDAASWTVANALSPGAAIRPDAGPDGMAGVRLDYDFTRTGTRGAYAIVPEQVSSTTGRVVAGQPQRFTLWIRGEGRGEWPRLQVVTGDGVSTNLNGPNVTWTGWRQVEFPVPAGTKYPLTFQRVRIMETTAASYTGSVSVAGLQAIVPPDVALPEVADVHDPLIVTDGTVTGRAQQVAVMSDAQFVAAAPDSELVQAARRTLREIVAADPELLVINGDFVDKATVADIALAKRVLDEEIGDRLPYIYVPGNHEVDGGPITNFSSVFGATRQSVRLGGTQLVTLDSSRGSLAGSDAAQLAWFDDQLAAAAADPAVTGVLVFAHHPADDPLPSKNSQLGDRYEAAAFIRTLAEFRADSGKSIASIGSHVGVFDASSTDGVSRLVNGNSGKGPASTPDDGGFTGWTMLGLDPVEGVVGADPVTVTDRIEWLRAEVRPRVDALALSAPAVLEVGESAPVSATVTQDGDRQVPVAWPMSADWSGEGVQLVDGGVGAERAEADAAAPVVRVDPATGRVTALASGRATLAVTVNGVTETAEIEVLADPGTGGPGTGGPGTGGPGDGGDGGGDAGAGAGGDGADAGDGLAVSGADAMLPLVLALLLLAGGAAALWLRRPWRRASTSTLR